MNLTQLQELALAEMQEQRTSELRAERMRRAVLRRYRVRARRLGYTAAQVVAQVRDIRDIHCLRAHALEAADD